MKIIDFGVLTGCLLLVLLAFSYSAKRSQAYLARPELDIHYHNCFAVENSVYSYASSHKENLYVYDANVLSVYNPFPNVRCGDINNLFSWGGARMYTMAYNNQLAIHGRENLYSEAFFEDNIYLISSSTNNAVLLLNFLGEKYGGKVCIATEVLDTGVYIFKYFDSVEKALQVESAIAVWIYTPEGVAGCDMAALAALTA